MTSHSCLIQYLYTPPASQSNLSPPRADRDDDHNRRVRNQNQLPSVSQPQTHRVRLVALQLSHGYKAAKWSRQVGFRSMLTTCFRHLSQAKKNGKVLKIEGTEKVIKSRRKLQHDRLRSSIHAELRLFWKYGALISSSFAIQNMNCQVSFLC